MYRIETTCRAFSGRSDVEAGRVKAYFTVTEDEALQAILSLVQQGLDVGAIVETYERKENW